MTADRIAFVVDAVTDLEELAEYIDARNPVADPPQVAPSAATHAERGAHRFLRPGARRPHWLDAVLEFELRYSVCAEPTDGRTFWVGLGLGHYRCGVALADSAEARQRGCSTTMRSGGLRRARTNCTGIVVSAR